MWRAFIIRLTVSEPGWDAPDGLFEVDENGFFCRGGDYHDGDADVVVL
jgi:hypothetical protein